MKKNKQGITAIVIATIMIMMTMASGFFGVWAMPVYAASTTGMLPISCYTLSGRATTFTDADCTRTTGFIDNIDLAKITAIYPDKGSVRVSYPTSRGTKQAYARMSAFFSDISFNAVMGKTGKRLTAYRRSTGAASIGTVFSDDECIAIGRANGRTQLIYPSGRNNYKMGWVNGTYDFSGPSVNMKYLDICFNAVYYANANPDLKAAFGYDYDRLLEHWLTYGLKEGRSASPVFDPKYYLQANTDVAAVMGWNNYEGALEHFIADGMEEGRASSAYFDGNCYRDWNGDLYSLGFYGRAQHYINYGAKEGRRANRLQVDSSLLEKDATVPTGSDFQWPVSNYYVCGNRWSEYYGAKGKDHLGMDIKSSSGDTNIYAAGSGTVEQTGWNSANGNTVTIKHTISGQTVYSFYAHLSSVCVSRGESVSKGQKIGVIGNTGSSSTGTHLHFAFTTQKSSGTWGYGDVFTDSNNSANYYNYKFYNPEYIISNGRLP